MLIGRSPPQMAALLRRRVQEVAGSAVDVLIRETRTGKGTGGALPCRSQAERQGNFVTNAAACRTLLDSELFGHEAAPSQVRRSAASVRSNMPAAVSRSSSTRSGQYRCR